MRGLGTLVKHNLNLMLWKRKSKFLISIIIPIFIIFFVSKLMLGQGSGIKVGVVNNDKSNVSKYIVSELTKNKDVTVINLTDSQLKSEFAQNSIQTAVVINSNFEKDLLAGDNTGVKIIGRSGDDSYKLIEQVVNSNLSNIENLAIAAKGSVSSLNSMLLEYQKSNINISLASKSNVKNELSVSNVFIGFLMMFILMRAVFGAERIIEDKKSGVLERVLLTETSIFKYYLANILASLFAISLQIISALLLVKYVTNTNFGMSIFDMFIILFITGIFAVALGTICISVTKNTEESGMLANVIIIVLLMLGGCFIPISLFPNFMDKISNFVPTRWIMNSIVNIQGGSHLISQWGNLLLVILISLVLLLIATFITKSKDVRNA